VRASHEPGVPLVVVRVRGQNQIWLNASGRTGIVDIGQHQRARGVTAPAEWRMMDRHDERLPFSANAPSNLKISPS